MGWNHQLVMKEACCIFGKYDFYGSYLWQILWHSWVKRISGQTLATSHLFFTPKVAGEGKSPSKEYPSWRNIIIWPDSSYDMNLSQVHISQNAPHVFRIFTYHLASNLWGKFVGKSSIPIRRIWDTNVWGPRMASIISQRGPRECASAPVAGPDPSPGNSAVKQIASWVLKNFEKYTNHQRWKFLQKA